MRILLAILLCSLTASAWAADQQASRSTFTKLMDVQEMWEEERYEEAMVKLEELIAATRGRPYDYALANQYFAHTAVMMGNAERARPALESALDQTDLPVELIGNLKMLLAQIVMGEEEFDLARRLFDDWLAVAEEPPSPAQRFSVAYAHYMSGHVESAEQHISQAIAETARPSDNWLRLHYQILFDLERYAMAKGVVDELLNRDPDNEGYWRLLASHHMRLEDYKLALASIETAYVAGTLESESDLKRIASLYGHVAVPEKAARKLEGWMQDERITADAATWRQLGDLWMLARERENAKTALWKAAEMNPDADTFEFLASIHFEDAEWQRSFEAFERAIRLGDADGEDLHRLEMLTGLTAMRAGHESDAREYLRLAEASSELRGQVRGILRELNEN